MSYYEGQTGIARFDKAKMLITKGRPSLENNRELESTFYL